MKKCGSTALKSLEQLVEATKLISTDGSTPSVAQQMEEQNCQNFSLRGYVADMRVKNPNACNPFEGRQNAESTWERLRGPLDVPRFRWWRCKNCVRRVVRSSTSAEQRLNAKQSSLQIIIPLPGKNSSVEHRAAEGDSNKAPTEVIMLADSADEGVIALTPSLEELTKNEEKASAGNGATTNTLRQTENGPCLDKGKNIITEVEDDGEEFDRQPPETTKAIGDSSCPWGDTEVENNHQISGFFYPSRSLNRGPPYGQAVLDDLNAKTSGTASTLRNQQQQRKNISIRNTLDLSLTLSIPRTEENQKMKNGGISVESNRKRKGAIDAVDNVSGASLKSRRRMEMGKFLKQPFTSCEIIDLESASFNTDGTTRPVTSAYAKREIARPIPRKYAKASSESSRPREDKHKGPVKKSGTGENPRVRMLNMAAPHIARPLSPINQVCLLSRNPADFSEPGPENIYMM